MAKIYTRTGDEGETSLFGGGRVSKTHVRLEAYGTVDETNAFVGLCLAELDPEWTDISQVLEQTQSRLFDVGAHLATPSSAEKASSALPTLEPAIVDELEGAMDRLEADLPKMTHFILPGGSRAAAALHAARTVCRRGERAIVALASLQDAPIHPVILPYINRLSDYLFVASRAVLHRRGIPETPWIPHRPPRSST